jgi:ribosomal protein L20A (L18A)
MRQHNKYLEKVYEEMDVYRQHLLQGTELSMQQQETFDKIDVIRAWLKDGFSDSDVIKLAKNHPILRVQDRRARELLAMAYEVFAELRQLRNREGIKYMYAEAFREAAKMALEVFIQETKKPASKEEDFTFGDDEPLFLNVATEKDLKAAAMMMKEFRGLMKEAAIIDGAYDNSKLGGEDKKKPTKIIIKRKTVIQNSEVKEDNLIEEAHYEDGE